uniref:Aprataxin and PNKP like factor n=1 Tax=Nannospalax galili TaxID=1026970 RepID=A0A8C6W7W8_NANGA
MPLVPQITDKRVSRRHAILEVLGNQLQIKPVNQTSVLLYRNSQVLDKEDISYKTPESAVPNLPGRTTGASQLQRRQELTRTKSPLTDSLSFSECTDFSEQQGRVCPAWMLGENLSDQNHSRTVISGNNVMQRCGKEGTCKDKTPVNVTWQGRKWLISSGNSENVSAEQDAGKKCKNYDQERPVDSSKKVPESSPPITLSDIDMGTVKTHTQSNCIPIEELGEASKQKIIINTTANTEETSPSNVPSTSFPEKSQGSHPECSSDPSSPDTLLTDTNDSLLGVCMYGANCYRKNPVHFQHFGHPGDSDYGDVQVTDETVTDDQPECPYGASCYKKNPQHKIEYRHSTLPVRVATEEDSDDVGQSRENNLNDKEYELTDEGSDWQPGKEDEEEDVEELLKEAKKCMERKK